MPVVAVNNNNLYSALFNLNWSPKVQHSSALTVGEIQICQRRIFYNNALP